MGALRRRLSEGNTSHSTLCACSCVAYPFDACARALQLANQLILAFTVSPPGFLAARPCAAPPHPTPPCPHHPAGPGRRRVSGSAGALQHTGAGAP